MRAQDIEYRADGIRMVGQYVVDDSTSGTIKFLEDIAAVPTPDTTPQRTAQFVQDELSKWAPVIKAAGIRLE